MGIRSGNRGSYDPHPAGRQDRNSMFGEGRCEDQAHVSEANAAVMRWIDKREHMPTEADADDQGCVLAWHRYQGVVVLNVHNVANYGSYVTHWMKTPAKP